MIAIKSKSQSQQNYRYKSSFISFVQWLVLVFYQTALLGTLSLFCHLFRPISLVAYNAHRFFVKRVSLASLYEFVRLSLIANGFIPAGTHYWNSFYTTEDELETYLEYTDLVLPTKAVSTNGIDTIWQLSSPPTDNDIERISSNSNVLYDVQLEDPGPIHTSRVDSGPFPTVDLDSLHVISDNTLIIDSNVSTNNQPLNDFKSLISPVNSTSTSVQKTLPQPKPSTTDSKKKKTSKPTAAEPAIEKPVNAKRKTNKHSSSLPINTFQPSSVTSSKGSKSPKSQRNMKARFDNMSSFADTTTSTLGTRSFSSKKRHSSTSSESNILTDTFVPTCPASHLTSFQNGFKKQKKQPLSKKKFFDQMNAPQHPIVHKKASTESLQQVIEEKGFKLVKKKSKKKKSLSVDKNLDKSVTVVRLPLPAAKNVMDKVNNTPKFTSRGKEDKKGSVSSVWRTPLLESDSQDISDIMDAALHNISALSDNDDNADINRYSSPVSSNSSCSSPVSVKWSLDNRYFGYNGISSPVIVGTTELNLLQQSSPWSPKPEDNFPTSTYSNGGFYPVRGFASSPIPQAVSPMSMYSPQSLFMAVDCPLVTPAVSTAPGAKRSNTRVTNSMLTWSVPDHLRSNKCGL